MTREELDKYCYKYQHTIFVRVLDQDGKWRVHPLSQLETSKVNALINNWLNKEIYPSRIERTQINASFD